MNGSVRTSRTYPTRKARYFLKIVYIDTLFYFRELIYGARGVMKVMTGHSSVCPDPDCGREVDYWRVHCICGQFVGFPNYRVVAAERAELAERYDAAQEDCEKRGVMHLLIKIEELCNKSQPVIAMPFAASDDILRDGKYRNYSQRIESGERDPAGAEDHADREIVGARLFPAYSNHIHYAALSSDGRGLPSYGSVAVRWRVTPIYLGRRATLLEDNSFIFYDRHSLGQRHACIPPGYRAIWEDRMKLAAAKLAPRLTPTTGESGLPGLLLKPGRTRKDDDFIEVAIFADGGLDTHDVDMVTVQKPPATVEEAYRRDLVQNACTSRGIRFVE